MDTGRIICMGSYGTKTTKADVKEPSVENEKNVVTRSDFLLYLNVVFLKNNWHLRLLNLKLGFRGLSAF